MPWKSAAVFVKQREHYRGWDYLCCTLGYHLAPVLEMLRPAVMLSFGGDRRRLGTLWEINNHLLLPTGKICYYELKKTEKRVHILFYHRQLLARTIQQEDVRFFLQGFGYSEQLTLPDALKKLRLRFQQGCCPPELGIFLGIPLEDVAGFITYGGKNYRIRGPWKVYANLQQACTLFSLCEKAKIRFLDFIRRGYHPVDYLRIHASSNIK